jgi:hypothetical protein
VRVSCLHHFGMGDPWEWLQPTRRDPLFGLLDRGTASRYRFESRRISVTEMLDQLTVLLPQWLGILRGVPGLVDDSPDAGLKRLLEAAKAGTMCAVERRAIDPDSEASAGKKSILLGMDADATVQCTASGMPRVARFKRSPLLDQVTSRHRTQPPSLQLGKFEGVPL